MKAYLIYLMKYSEMIPLATHLDYDKHAEMLKDLLDKRDQFSKLEGEIKKLDSIKWESICSIDFNLPYEEIIDIVNLNIENTNKSKMKIADVNRLQKEFVIASNCREDVKSDMLNVLDKKKRDEDYESPGYYEYMIYTAVLDLTHKYSGLE